MRPIRTVESNFTYLGPSPEVADLPGQREQGRFYSVWHLTDEDRAKIAAGANVELGIYCEPIPPVSMAVVDVPESPLSTHGVDHRCVDCSALYVGQRAIDLEHKCGQCGAALKPVEVPS
jgi:hypothetical protein